MWKYTKAVFWKVTAKGTDIMTIFFNCGHYILYRLLRMKFGLIKSYPGVVRTVFTLTGAGQKCPTHLTSVSSIQWSWNLILIITTSTEVESQIFVVIFDSVFCWRQQNFALSHHSSFHAHCGKSLISVFEGVFARIKKILILAGRQGTGLSFYGV